jgi:hypothetical protein
MKLSGARVGGCRATAEGIYTSLNTAVTVCLLDRLVNSVKLHNEELRDLYSSPSIIRIIKSRRMRCLNEVPLPPGKNPFAVELNIIIKLKLKLN